MLPWRLPPAVALIGRLALTCPRQAAVVDAGAAPPGRYAFQSYGAENGLENLAELSFAQDETGYLWTGSQDGLYRYDGEAFRRFGLDEGLPSVYVSALLAVNDGRFYAGTYRGLAVFRGGRFVKLGAEAGLPDATVRALVHTRSGRILVGTSDGLFVETHQDQYVRYPGYPNVAVSALWLDRDGTVFAARGPFLERFRGDGARRTFGQPDGLGGDAIESLVRDGHGRLWAHSRNRLWLQAAGGDAFTDRSCLLPSPISEGRMSLTPEGDLLVPTAKGILRIGADSADVIDSDRGLPTDEALSAFVDRDGSFWVASVGVHRMLGRGLWSIHTKREGLPNDVIWSVTRGPDNRIWVGTDDGLARSSGDGWDVIPNTEGHSFRALVWGPGGSIWSAGSPAELVQLDPETLAVKRYGVESGLRGSEILGLALDASGIAWVGTSNAGLFRSEQANDVGPLHFVPMALPGGTADEPISWITSDASRRIWAAGEYGLGLVEGQTTRRFNSKDGLRKDHLTGVTIRQNGEVCVTYFEPFGLSCFRATPQGLFGVHHLDSESGLPSNKVYAVGDDRAGRLWVGTAAGIAVFDGEDVEMYRRTDGTPGDDIDAMAIFADGPRDGPTDASRGAPPTSKGDLWIGTSTGLGRFDGKRVGALPPPRSVLGEIQLGERTLSGDAPPRDLNVRYEDATLDVHFSALGFTKEARIVHEIRLLGLDDRWRVATGHEAAYAALGPGRYQFEVRARFGHGRPGPAATLPFHVLPAWWQTPWVWLGGTAFVAGLLVSALRLRDRAHAARSRALEAMVAARTRELTVAQQKVLEVEKLSAMGRVLAQLSHELNNPINVISNNLGPMKAYLYDLSSAVRGLEALAVRSPLDREQVDLLLSEKDIPFVLDDFPKALRTVELSAARVQAIQADLRGFMRGDTAPSLETGDVHACLAETADMVRRGLPSGVRVVERYGPKVRVAFSPGELNQVMLNLLQNAAFAVGDAGEVAVTTTPIAGALEIAVSDSGPGIPEAIRTKIFEPFFTTKDVGKGTGLGLAICRQFIVEHHGGTLELDGAHAGGARFVIRLPVVDDGA